MEMLGNRRGHARALAGGEDGDGDADRRFRRDNRAARGRPGGGKRLDGGLGTLWHGHSTRWALHRAWRIGRPRMEAGYSSMANRREARKGAGGPGFEPGIKAPKTLVIPFHHPPSRLVGSLKGGNHRVPPGAGPPITAFAGISQ